MRVPRGCGGEVYVVFRWRGCLLKWIEVGFLTNGKRQSMCVLSKLKFAWAFVQSFLFFPFRVSSNRYIMIRLSDKIWCHNDVVSTLMRRHQVALMLIQCYFHVMCPLGLFMQNIGEMDELLSE